MEFSLVITGQRGASCVKAKFWPSKRQNEPLGVNSSVLMSLFVLFFVINCEREKRLHCFNYLVFIEYKVLN